MNKPILSIVVPCFNEEESINFFYEEVNRVVREMNVYEDTEFVFVDDGSSDKTLNILKELSNCDARVHFISFSRNFGKEAALYAGLSKAKGEYTAVMDAVWRGNEKITKYRISKGADLNTINKEGQNNLMLAVGANRESLVKLLAENGADPDVKDMMGMSAYNYAVLFKKQKLVEILTPYHKAQ